MSSSVTCQLNNKAYKQNLVKKRKRMKIKIKRIEDRRRAAIPKTNVDWVVEFHAQTYLQTPLPLPEFFPIGQWNRFE